MRQTPLFTRHITSALKVINLKGVARAVEYVGHRAEHKAIREGVSICDASHLGEVEIEGPDTLNFADHILTNDIAKLPVGKAAYTMMCRENGRNGPHSIPDHGSEKSWSRTALRFLREWLCPIEGCLFQGMCG